MSSPKSHQAVAAPLDQIVKLQERITQLEKELLSTKMQLAISKSSEDNLRAEIAMMSSALASTELLSRGVAVCRAQKENANTSSFTQRKMKKSSSNKMIHRRALKKASSSIQKKKKMLNPSSCASALNLLDGSESFSSSSSQRGTIRQSLQRQRSQRAVLKLNSCASGLELLSAEMTGQLGNNNNVISQPSTTGISMLLGNARLSSSSSLSNRQRRANSRDNNTRLNNSMIGHQGNSNRNAEWDLFE